MIIRGATIRAQDVESWVAKDSLGTQHLACQSQLDRAGIFALVTFRGYAIQKLSP
jgi:hypothetical protein